MNMGREQKNFYSLVMARSLISLGTQAQAVVVSWFVYELTHSAFYLGLIGLFEFLPALLLAFYAGVVVDRHDRSKLYRNSILLSTLVPVGLWWLAWKGPLLATGPEDLVDAVLALMALSGFARAFLSPAGIALTGEIIPRGKMVRANAWLTSAWQLSVVIGPALGGFVYAFGGAKVSFLVSFGCQFLGFIFAFLIKGDGPRVKSIEMDPFLQGTRRAWEFLKKEPRLFAAILLDMLAVLFGGAVALLPIFAEQLGFGSVGLGFLRAAPAIGSLAMALVLVKRPPSKRTGEYLLASVAGFGISILLFAFSRNFLLSFCALVLSGVFDAVSVVIRGTLLQLLTPDSIKGRVSSLNSLFINSSNELGDFESGVTASFMGAVPAAALGGILTLVTVVAIAVIFPSLRGTSLHDLEKET